MHLIVRRSHHSVTGSIQQSQKLYKIKKKTYITRIPTANTVYEFYQIAHCKGIRFETWGWFSQERETRVDSEWEGILSSENA